MQPHANYLIYTAPHIEPGFCNALKRVPLFRHLPDPLLQFIFRYSKFISLKKGDRPIKQGMFDQDIFILIKGQLNVFLEVDGHEAKIDEIAQPFSLFGERCILGEPRGASIAAAEGGALLMGIDLSRLPDFLAALENPEERLEDSDYGSSKAMYQVFAGVLVDRLHQLYKHHKQLMFHFMRIKQSLPIMRRTQLIHRLFMEFTENRLAAELAQASVIEHITQKLKHPELAAERHESPVDTKKLYLKMLNLHARGKLDDFEEVLYKILEELARIARFLPSYKEMMGAEPSQGQFRFEIQEYFTGLFAAFAETGLFERGFSVDWLANALIVKAELSYDQLLAQIEERFRVEGDYNLTWLNFLICRESIYNIGKLNQINARISGLLRDVSSIDAQGEVGGNLELVGEFETIHEESMSGKKSGEIKERQNLPTKTTGAQDNVDDLLAQFGMS